jgi:hypothetical protein
LTAVKPLGAFTAEKVLGEGFAGLVAPFKAL